MKFRKATNLREWALMGWNCVYIEKTRIAKAVNATFRNMLIGAYLEKGQPPNCHVYFRQGDGGYYYYFAPTATTVLGVFMKYWEGYEVSDPRRSQSRAPSPARITSATPNNTTRHAVT